jgi:hypothetical protein
MNVIERVKRFFVQGPPPEPDVDRDLHVHHTIKRLISTDRTCRIIIAGTPEGTFTFRAFQWDTSDWKVAGSTFWNDVTPSTSLTDSPENAERLARETMSEFEFEEQDEPNRRMQAISARAEKPDS